MFIIHRRVGIDTRAPIFDPSAVLFWRFFYIGIADLKYKRHDSYI